MKKPAKLSTIQCLKTIVVIIMTIIIGGISILSLSIQEKNNELMMDRSELILNANRFMDGSAYLTSEVRSYVATGDVAHFENYWNEVNTLKNRDIAISNMKEIGITAEEEATIEAMQNISNTLIPLEDKAMEQTREGLLTEALESVYGKEYSDGLAEIATLNAKFYESLQVRTAESIAQSQKSLATINTVIIVLLVVLIALITLTEVAMNRVVVQPIIKSANAINEISKGYLKGDIDVSNATLEIFDLTSATKTILKNLEAIISDMDYSLSQMAEGNFNFDSNKAIEYYQGDYKPLGDSKLKIINSLSNTLMQINTASVQVNIGSEQVALGAQSLSQGSVSQSESIQSLADTIKEITKEISDTANDSQKAKTATDKAINTLEIGNKQMKEMIGAMGEISNRSQEIHKIIKAIDDIAFQTNILSLNAAVEAARAGVAGRGFAVVAEEVRNLASKSAQSAKDTAMLIGETISAIEQGEHIANNTATSIQTITEETREVSYLVDSISSSSQYQSGAVRDINENVEAISGVIHANSATAEESAAASEELSGQAQMLQDLVVRFTLKENNDTIPLNLDIDEMKY